jgi:hypothetical protein
METDRYSNLAVCKKPLNKGFFAPANAGSRECSSGNINFWMSTNEDSFIFADRPASRVVGKGMIKVESPPLALKMNPGFTVKQRT